MGELQGTLKTLDNISGILNASGELIANLGFPITVGGYVVYNAYIDVDGDLIFELYDKTEINVGHVKGEDGDAFTYEDFTPEQLMSLSAGSNYTHEQMLSSAHWIINHTLNRYPSVTIVDTGGNIVMGDVVYISMSRVEITFTSQFSGKAYLT
jgi:hypothetical protein